MLRKTVKFENFSVSDLHYIGHGMNFSIPGGSIGDAGVSVNLPLEHEAAIKAAVLATRPAMKMTDGSIIEDGIYPDYMPFQKDNYAGAAAPTVNDDATKGYSVGSVWINTTSAPPETYRCVSAATGAAKWLNTSLEQGELGTLALQNANNVGVDINLASTKVYKVNGAQVVGAPGLAVADAGAVTGTATSNGFGFVSAAEMNSFISGVNAIKDAANAVIARLEGHGLIAT